MSLKLIINSLGKASVSQYNSSMRFLRFILWCTALSLAGILLYRTFVYVPAFPMLKEKVYLGSISIGEEHSTFYFEQVDENTAMVLVLAPGQKAEQLKLTLAAPSFLGVLYRRFLNPNAVDKWNPPSLRLGKTTVSLLEGVSIGSSFQGSVMTEEQEVGSWTLKPWLEHATRLEPITEDIQAWLALARRQALLNERLQKVTLSDKSGDSSVENYRRLLSSQSIVFRAEKVRRDLERDLFAMEKQIELTKEKISELAGELGLHGRISPIGKVAQLARKVARRENRWYLLNWTDARPADSEIAAAQRMNIDLQALNAAAKRAEEVQRLQLEILKEQQIIDQLTAPTEMPPAATEEPARENRGGFFGLF